MRKIASASGPDKPLTKPRSKPPGSKETSGLPLDDMVLSTGSPKTNLCHQNNSNDLQISKKHASSQVLKNVLLMNEPYKGPRTYRLNSAVSKRTFREGLDTQASMNELLLIKDNDSPTKEQILEGAAKLKRAKSGA
jgi:hypothetical protein